MRVDPIDLKPQIDRRSSSFVNTRVGSLTSVRSIAITGVIPLPPETNKMRRGRCAGRTKSPPA